MSTEPDQPQDISSDSIALLDCKCSYEAGKVDYSGGRSGRWEIRCTNSRCPAVVMMTNRDSAIEAWNDMQSAI